MTARRPSRAERRAQERDARKLVREKQKLAKLEVGGSPERPITVPSASVIEVHAASVPCPLCAGSFKIDEHAARTVGGRMLREVAVTCLRCGVSRSLWFSIGSPLLS